MLIHSYTTTSPKEPVPCNKPQKEDLLKLKEFNDLPSPVTARLLNGEEYWIEALDVRTGLMRLYVCGLIDCEGFTMVKTLIDSNGVEHDPDMFYNDPYPSHTKGEIL
tara:strand:+ start:62 stop:382 length:321 start_codon:yes stop_codon:yes gene_type:complete